MTTNNPFLGLKKIEKAKAGKGRRTSDVSITVTEYTSANQRIVYKVRLSLSPDFMEKHAPEIGANPDQGSLNIFVGEKKIGIELKEDESGEYTLRAPKYDAKDPIYKLKSRFSQFPVEDLSFFEKGQHNCTDIITLAEGCFLLQF